jgi:Ca2+-binding EF-hand superfamily protein
MGNKAISPDGNARLKRLVKTFLLSSSDINKLNKAFNKVDNTRTGKVTLAEIFKGYEIENWKMIGEALATLNDIELDYDEPECIDFCDFASILLTFCCFEPPEVLRLCMYCYDPEKNGYIEVDDLKSIMNNLHGIQPPDTVIGNEKGSWAKLEFPQNGKIEFTDIVEIHGKAPLILKPVFRLQTKMMMKFCGEGYWEWKKRSLYESKIRAEAIFAKKKAKKEKKARAGKDRKIKKKMGILRYYCCPCIRSWYDEFDESKLTEDEKAQRARLARLEQLAAKNPETSAWKKYQKKADPTAGGKEAYTVEKVLKTERHREARAMGRAARRQERKDDDGLKMVARTSDQIELL